MIFWKVCTKFRTRESDLLKTALELYDMEIHQKISRLDYQKLKNDGEEKCRIQTSSTKI